MRKRVEEMLEKEKMEMGKKEGEFSIMRKWNWIIYYCLEMKEKIGR